MKNKLRKIIILILLCSMITTLFSCNKMVDNKKNQEVENIDEWVEYDKLINEIKNMKASEERDVLLHKAEEMLMNQYCIIPVENTCVYILKNENVNGAYCDSINIIHIGGINFNDNRKVANVQLYTEPTTLDSGLSSNTSDASILQQLSGTLVRYNEEGEIVNYFLDHYELSDDNLTYKMVLKDNLKWSDGKPLTAKDFVYTLKRNANPQTGAELSFILDYIDGFPNNLNVKIIDEKTFEIKVKKPCPFFMSIFASTLTMPLREDIVEGDAEWYFKTPMITSGPFVLKEWKHKESMVLEKNPYFFDKDNVKVDRINVMLNANVTSIYNAYKNGDIDLAVTVPKDVVDKNIIKYRTVGNRFLKFNTKSKLFAGMSKENARKLRYAISLCIDRNFMEGISGGRFDPSYAYINDKFVDSSKKTFFRNLENYKYPFEKGYMEDINLDKAREILKEIGYHIDENGKVKEDIVIELMAPSGDGMSILQTDLEKVGIALKIRKLETQYVNSGNYTMVYIGWIPDYFDPLAMLEIFESNNLNNTCFLNREIE